MTHYAETLVGAPGLAASAILVGIVAHHGLFIHREWHLHQPLLPTASTTSLGLRLTSSKVTTTQLKTLLRLAKINIRMCERLIATTRYRGCGPECNITSTSINPCQNARNTGTQCANLKDVHLGTTRSRVECPDHKDGLAHPLAQPHPRRRLLVY